MRLREGVQVSIYQRDVAQSACQVFRPSSDRAQGLLHLIQVLFTCVVSAPLSLQPLLPLQHLQVAGEEDERGLVLAER